MCTLNKILRCVIIICFAGLAGCSSNKTAENKVDSISLKQKLKTNSNPAFSLFLKKFNRLSLPLIINVSKIKLDSTKILTDKDNTFIKYPDSGTLYAYGMLSDTTDTFKILWLQPADDYIPVITTFTKDGQKIDSKYVGVGGCGVDCCFECNEVIVINKDLTTFSADSIKSCECDTAGPKENTMRKYIRYQTGKILKTGKIDISKVLEKPFR